MYFGRKMQTLQTEAEGSSKILADCFHIQDETTLKDLSRTKTKFFIADLQILRRDYLPLILSMSTAFGRAGFSFFYRHPT